jgi:SAM-dependent methyltransferase
MLQRVKLELVALSFPIVMLGCRASEQASSSSATVSAPSPSVEAHGHHHDMPHRFEHAEEWAKEFDDPARDSWQMPIEVARALELRSGHVVADVGAGTGYFEAYLAFAVAPAGKVLALDVEPDMVRYLGERAKKEGFTNVVPVLVPPDDPKLDEASVDRVLVVDTWHHLGSRGEYAKKLARALKPGGFVLVVDFDEHSDLGPPKEHRIPPDTVMAELSAAGLGAHVVDLHLPKQYVVRGDKPAASAPASSSSGAPQGSPSAAPSAAPSSSAESALPRCYPYALRGGKCLTRCDEEDDCAPHARPGEPFSKGYPLICEGHQCVPLPPSHLHPR